MTVSPAGSSVPRIEGPLKVSGIATYTSDFNFPGLLYAVPVCATIGSGTIAGLDTSVSGSMPGVQAVYHRANIGRIYRSAPDEGLGTHLDERRPPFEDDVIRYYGQYVAAAVADALPLAPLFM